MQEITLDNVFDMIKEQEQQGDTTSQQLIDEINFISTHLYEIIENRKEDLRDIRPGTLLRILENENIKIKNEDQLLTLINELYQYAREYSILYEAVAFRRVSAEKMKDFVEVFDMKDLSQPAWRNLCGRLVCDIKD